MSTKTHNASRSYIIGFILALILTNIAFIVVSTKTFTGWALVSILAVLAILQLWVQLRFFLHLGRESDSRWNLLMFLFAALVVCILVFGSLWIMKNLSYHGMPASDTEKEIMEEERIYR